MVAKQLLIGLAEDKTNIRDEQWEFIGCEIVDEEGTEENYLSSAETAVQVRILTREDHVLDVSIVSLGVEDVSDIDFEDDVDEDFSMLPMGI